MNKNKIFLIRKLSREIRKGTNDKHIITKMNHIDWFCEKILNHKDGLSVIIQKLTHLKEINKDE